MLGAGPHEGVPSPCPTHYSPSLILPFPTRYLSPILLLVLLVLLVLLLAGTAGMPP